MKYIYLLFAFLLMGTSCKEKSPLEEKVIAIHDEVMPKLGKLNKIKKHLSKALPSIKDEAMKQDVLGAIKKLEDADDGMMDWMAEWNVPDKEPAQTEYLNKEMVRITKVKKDMLTSMQAGEELLNKVVPK